MAALILEFFRCEHWNRSDIAHSISITNINVSVNITKSDARPTHAESAIIPIQEFICADNFTDLAWDVILS